MKFLNLTILLSLIIINVNYIFTANVNTNVYNDDTMSAASTPIRQTNVNYGGFLPARFIPLHPRVSS